MPRDRPSTHGLDQSSATRERLERGRGRARRKMPRVRSAAAASSAVIRLDPPRGEVTYALQLYRYEVI